MQRNTVVAAAIPLISGILAQDFLPISPRLWLSILAVLIPLCIWLKRRSLICTFGLATAIFLVGLVSAQLRTSFVPVSDISLLASPDERLVQLELKITQPAYIAGGFAEMRQRPLKQIFAADATAIQTPAGWKSVSGKVVFMVEPVESRLGPGQTLRAAGWLSQPAPPANPGEFDSATYDRRQGVGAIFRARRPETIEIIQTSGPSPCQRLRTESERLLADGFPPERIEELRLLELLVLGQSDRHVADIKQEFARTGTAYQLSISGLHIAIIGAATLMLLRLLRVSPRPAVWIALAVVALYATIAQPTEAGMRALVMCVAAAIGLLARRRTSALQLLAVAVLVILLADPSELYEAGFQIGVASVLGLILFSRRVGLFVGQLWRSDDPWMDKHPPKPLAIRLIRAILRRVWQILLASSIAWICVMPLVAYHFQMLSPWSVPGGVLMLPLTVVALLAGVLKIVLTLLLGKFASLWAFAAIGPTILLRDGIGLLARLPSAGVVVTPPTLAAIVCYYALLALPILPWRSLPIRRVALLGPALGCFLLFTLPLQAPDSGRTNSQALHLTLLSVGSGQAAAVRLPNGHTVIVDCGSSSIPNVYIHVIQPYLHTQRVRHVDEVFLSHVEYADISAASELLQDFKVPTLCVTPDFRGRADSNFAAQTLLDNFHQPVRPMHAGDRFDIGQGASIQILWPPPNCSLDSNNSGLVLKLNFAGRSILFPGDIQEKAIVALLAHPNDLKADVLVAPHHGIAETRSADFLQAVDPQMILCSSDRALSAKQREFDLVASPWPLYRTSQCGAIDVSIGNSGRIGVRTFLTPNPTPPAARIETAGMP